MMKTVLVLELSITNQYRSLILLIKEQKQGSKITRVEHLSTCVVQLVGFLGSLDQKRNGTQGSVGLRTGHRSGVCTFISDRVCV